MSTPNVFRWAVIGAGPAGVTAVGLLLDAGVLGDEIIWIDPYFQVGDFGRLWGEVNSNTRVSLFLQCFQGINSFEYNKKIKTENQFALDKMDPDGYTVLQAVAEPFSSVTTHLQKKVISVEAIVHEMDIHAGAWELQTNQGNYLAKKVIIATGSEAKSMDFPGVAKIDLVTALTPSQLKKTCDHHDTVAVFGSSHSAMIAIRNLVEVGVKKIINFYLSPLCYAVLMDDWILYDDTGLKGETAKWVKENISQKCLPNISRYLSTPEHIDLHLSKCNKAIYAVGFQQRHIPIPGVLLAHYDVSNGIIAPGLFGVGIGFPIVVIDPFGRQEWNVGVWKFLKNMRRALPLWEKYDL